MDKKAVVLDTDVFIEYLRQNEHVLDEIEKHNKILLTSITVAEVKFQAQNKTELQKINKILSFFEVLNINSKVEEVFLTLFDKYILSHRPSLQDFYIASICIHNREKLFTLNTKHFKFIKKLFKNRIFE